MEASFPALPTCSYLDGWWHVIRSEIALLTQEVAACRWTLHVFYMHYGHLELKWEVLSFLQPRLYPMVWSHFSNLVILKTRALAKSKFYFQLRWATQEEVNFIGIVEGSATYLHILFIELYVLRFSINSHDGSFYVWTWTGPGVLRYLVTRYF